MLYHINQSILPSTFCDEVIKEGEEKSLTVVIEFPNKEKALGWYNSPEHQKIVVHRRAATDPSSPIVICEESNTY